MADGHVICELVISPCCIKPVFSWMSAVELQAAFIPARLWDLVSGEKEEIFFSSFFCMQQLNANSDQMARTPFELDGFFR